MKKNVLTLISFACFIIMFAGMQSCTKELPTHIVFESYTYATIDSNGADWEPIYLTGTSLIDVPEPFLITSPEYLSELESLKSMMSSITDEQQQAIDYWGNNTMIRWMEIACELSAKYNLAASPENGTYEDADPVFPDLYPNYPFAHPTFSSRMFSYLAVSIYDALLTTWNYKYDYNRMAPYKVDENIIQAYPDNYLPSYPSEDAVIATVAEQILMLMFPLEVDYIQAKADEVRSSRLWAGMNVQSDIDAGEALGYSIAEIFIGRAKNDSMKFALLEDEEYFPVENAADSLWGSQWPHWENLEVPQRPVGITPKYGSVIPWFIPDVELVRPGPPPAIGSEEYYTAVQELIHYSENITKEEKEKAFFWSDGTGTYTPQGHWNWFANEYIVQNKMSPLRTARLLAYLNTAMCDAGISCWDTKYFYMYPRPSQTSPEVNTLFMLPNFPSYTSGHSTFSAAAAEVLKYFFPYDAAVFDSWAHEASESRIYARIHFRFDCEAGLEVGKVIGTYAVDAAKADGADFE